MSKIEEVAKALEGYNQNGRIFYDDYNCDSYLYEVVDALGVRHDIYTPDDLSNGSCSVDSNFYKGQRIGAISVLAYLYDNDILQQDDIDKIADSL